MSNKNRQTLHANQKRGNSTISTIINIYIDIALFIYIYILRSVEHKVLRYIPPNIIDVMHLSVTTVL